MAINSTPLGIRWPDGNEGFNPNLHMEYIAKDVDGLLSLAPMEWCGNVAGVGTLGTNEAKTSATVLTIDVPAGAGLRITGTGHFVHPGTPAGSSVGRVYVQASVDGSGWSSVTDLFGGTVMTGVAQTVTAVAEGYVAPSGSDRSVSLRCEIQRRGDGGVRNDGVYMWARLVRRA